MQKKKKHFSHGEVNLFEVEQIPGTAKKIEIKSDFLKLADSETLGNDHRLALNEDIEIYEDVDGTVYIKNILPTKVFCPHEERHATVDIPPSIWKKKISQEYDYITQEQRNVAD